MLCKIIITLYSFHGFSTLLHLVKMLCSLSVLLILFQSATLSFAQPNFAHSRCDNSYGNYTSNSTYHKNLNTLLSDLSSNTQITSGFYNFSSGTDPDIVNGIAMCRGDILLEDCRICLQNATVTIIGLCTNQKQAIVWYDQCMLRYTNRSIFGVMEDTPWYWIRNRYKLQNQDDYISVLSSMFSILLILNKEVAGKSTPKFNAGHTNVSSSQAIYAYTQCTPDLSQSDCYKCLSESITYLSDCCLPYKGARFFRPSCNIRYEDFKFLNAFDTIAFSASSPLSPSSLKAPSSPPSTLALSSPPPTPARGKGSSTPFKIVVAVIVICLFLAVVIYFCLRRKRKEGKKGNNGLAQDDDMNSTEALQIAYGDIKSATKDFAEANKLGRGGFGTVYKGVLTNGQEIAVKRLARNSVQGEVEFRTEVVLLAKLQHRNLVRLLGFSLAGDERLLIYEFVSNASLDHFLFGKNRNVSLDWQTRYNIIGGIARGLLYLHKDSRLRIIHRDLKASNILLDSHLNPKIADFGLARLFQADQTQADTQKIAGTFGYMAPEYTYRGIFSVKSDVYSFGVLVLEIICGKKISDIQEEDSTEDLITSVWRNWAEGTAYEVVDSALISPPRDETMKCIHIGLLCVQANPANRPTMSSVNRMLSSESLSLPQPCQPAYVLQRSLTRETQSVSVMEEESIAELHPR